LAFTGNLIASSSGLLQSVAYFWGYNIKVTTPPVGLIFSGLFQGVAYFWGFAIKVTTPPVGLVFSGLFQNVAYFWMLTAGDSAK